MSLTIQGEKSLEGKKWKRLDSFSDGKNILLLEQIQDEEIKVGDRVVCSNNDDGSVCMTLDMIYRVLEINDNNIYFLGDTQEQNYYHKSHFTKLQKPKEGDVWYELDNEGDIISGNWCSGDDSDNDVWDLGFGFHTKEQAEFCRDRVRRVI